MGDWEEFAVQEMGWFGDTEDWCLNPLQALGTKKYQEMPEDSDAQWVMW